MDSEAVREMLNKKPFRPFELITTAGEHHVVKHPEFVIVSSNQVVIVDPVSERTAIMSLIDVTEMRVLEPANS